MPLAVIFFTGHGDVPMTVYSLKAGAVHFLTERIAHELGISERTIKLYPGQVMRMVGADSLADRRY